MISPHAFASAVSAFPREVRGYDVNRKLAREAGVDDPLGVKAVEVLRRATQRDTKVRAGASRLMEFSADGKPAGISFVYEDPVLAAAAAGAQEKSRAHQGPISNAKIFQWMVTGVHMFLSHFQHAEQQQLAAKAPPGPLQGPPDVLRLAIFGDGGFASRPQEVVFDMIKAVALNEGRAFNFVLHLGDTYFSGSQAQQDENLLVPLKRLSRELSGTPTYSLCGNHDLYSGYGPWLHVLEQLDQPGRYFNIRGGGWNVICADTAFGSSGMLRDDGAIDPGQRAWLSDQLARDPSRTVLITHHFTVSGWDPPARTLSRDLPGLLKQPIAAWYWGHEHRMAAYAGANMPRVGGGACIGNAVFLQKMAPKIRPIPVQWTPPRGCNCVPNGKSYWPHGFLELELRAGPPPLLIERFHEEKGQSWERRIGAPG